MRTDSLYGARFADSHRLKQECLDEYAEWKTSVVYGFDKHTTAKFAFGQLMGRSEKELAGQEGQQSELPEIEDIARLLSRRGTEHFLIAASVLKWTEKMPMPDDFDLRELQRIPDGKRQLNFGNNFYRYEKNGDQIIVVSGHETSVFVEKGKMVGFDFYRIDLQNGLIHTPDAALRKKFDDVQRRKLFEVTQDQLERRAFGRIPGRSTEPNNFAKDSAIFEAHMKERFGARNFFLKLITFMELSEIQQIKVAPGKRYHHPNEEMELENHQGVAMTWVTNNWDKTLTTESFFVRPFWRSQRYGKGYSQVKRKYIHGFKKDGYNLKAGKLRVQQNKTEDLIPESHRQLPTDQLRPTNPSLSPGSAAAKAPEQETPFKKQVKKINYGSLIWKGKSKKK